MKSFAWQNIGVRVRDKATGADKQLVQGCCGRTKPGDLIALVGPSGDDLSQQERIPWLRHVPAICLFKECAGAAMDHVSLTA